MRITLITMGLCLMVVSAPHHAANALEIQCAKDATMVALLTKKYEEQPIAIGTVDDQLFMRLFVNTTNRTWTMLMTKTHGEACIVASGADWETLSRHRAELQH